MNDFPGNAVEFDRLLAYLTASRGFDFTAYKKTTLSRRIQKRMQVVGAESYAAYQDYLEVHQDEFQSLFNTILINVTSFFRDPEAWDYVAAEVVPRLLIAKGPGTALRVWVAGCASGEEAYTLAMVLTDALGEDSFRERVKIYATDLDDDALASSRLATYLERDVSGIPEDRRKRYFERIGDRLTFDRDLRRSIIFGRHDLLSDAPISRVDLLLCRNTLMYFNAEAQDRILSRFHFALNDGGYLFLGKAETLLTHTDLFTPLDMKSRVFTRVPRGRLRNRGFMFPAMGNGSSADGEADGQLKEAMFERDPKAQIAIDPQGRIALVNELARGMFGLTARDIGRPFQDLDVSFRPIELRTGIEQATGQKRMVSHRDVPYLTPSGEGIVLDIAVAPLSGDGVDHLGTSITFDDVTRIKRLRDELQNFNQELETAYEEVQSTNEELQTTNEELQSTVEELETTNEELQSTNEELETMNEELQSANEELEAINDELRIRSTELDRANSFLGSILGSLKDGVIVVDEEMRILAWNEQAEDLWGLRAEETLGRHLLNLDIGLPVEEFRNPVRTCLSTGEAQATTVAAINRRGRSLSCDAAFTPLRGNEGAVRGVIVLTVVTPVG